MSKPCVYRHFDADGVLLYVGFSLRAIMRQADHEGSSHWFRQIARIELEWFDTVADAAFAEVEAIQNERPRHNVTIPAIPSGDFKATEYSGSGRPKDYRKPEGDALKMALEWWAGPLHTDDVGKLIGQMTGTKPVSRQTMAAWLGKRPPHPDRVRKPRSDKKQ